MCKYFQEKVNYFQDEANIFRMEQKRKIYHFQEKKLIFSRPISHLMWNAHESAMSLLMNFDELEDKIEPKDLK